MKEVIIFKIKVLKIVKKPRLFGIILLTKKNFTKQKKEVFSMNNFTTNTYQIKREIVNFSKKICKNSNKVESKFVTDMIFRYF